jgi:NAD(P)-dependent dehydrogenase (short-subunit alcohol dehydrogenase family)
LNYEISGMRFVITGAATGIGLETARLVAQQGGEVVLSDVDDRAAAAAVEAICAEGGAAHFVHCDVTSEDEINELMAESAERMGGIDVLHNNAGISDAIVNKSPSLESLSASDWDRVMAVNLRAPFLCARGALPFLRKSGNPSIINAGSIASVVARPHTIAYGSSKGGIAMLTRSLALALAPDRIRVNCYAPGMVSTQMADRYFDAAPDPEAARAAILSNYLSPRLGVTADIASVVCYLASPAAAFINGVVWMVDGGFSAFKAASSETSSGRNST